MRRFLSVSTASLVVGGLLLATGGTSGAAAPTQPTLTAPNGQSAIKVGDEITFGGTVDPQATLNAAFIRLSGPSGQALEWDTNGNGQPDPGPPFNESPDRSVKHAVTLNGGQIAGSFVPPPYHRDCKNVQAPAGCGVTLHVIVDHPEGTQPEGVSNSLLVDILRPTITGWFMETTTELRVTFTEAVVNPDGDSPGDWRVEDDLTGQVIPVSGVCCDQRSTERVLTLSVEQDQDVTPRTQYIQPPVTGRETYLDGANNRLGADNRLSTAVDKVPPPAPTILDIAGKPPAAAVANDTTPAVKVGDLRAPGGQHCTAGHAAEVYLESDGNTQLSDGDPRVGGPVTAGADGTATVETSELGVAGQPPTTHRLYAIAVDCHGNPGPGSAGTYTLDTVPPTPLYAHTAGDSVEVGFSEPITGAADPTQWTLSEGGPVVNVDGAGSDIRTLSPSGNVPAGTTVGWAGADAFDAAGNALGSPFTRTALDAIPPVLQVTDPPGLVYVSTPQFTVRGTGPDGTRVEVFRDDNRDEQPDGPVMATGHVVSGSYAVPVDLRTNAPNNLLVQGVKVETEARGPFRPVPMIVHDDRVPTVTVLAPVEDDFIGGGRVFTIEWDADDANFGPGPIGLEFSRDGGATWKELALAEDNDGSFDWVVDEADTETGSIRVTAEDLAGQRTEGLSGRFSIDSVAPRFDAITQDSRTVKVAFSEPVVGTAAADEWLIDGLPASDAQAAGGAISELLLTTAPVQEIGAAATPEITYQPSGLPVRTPFTDRAGNAIPEGARTVTAADGIPPAVPTIDSINGSPADQPVTGTEPQPEVTLTGVGGGDTALVFLEEDGQAGLTANDREVGRQENASSTQTMTVADLGPDGQKTLYAATQDASGNRSGSDDAVYILDRLVPRPLFAKTDPEAATILVGFSEDLASGLDAALEWTVSQGGPVLTVSGTGDEKLLTLATPAPVGASLTWTQPPAGGYADAAGNPLGTFTIQLLGVIPPLLQVTDPPGQVWVAETEFTVAGTVEQAGTHTVEAYRDQNRDGQPDGAAVATAGVSGNTFQVPVPLTADADNDFLVRGIGAEDVAGPYVPVPTIVQDSIDPSVSVLAPAGGEILAGDSSFTVQWDAQDANFGPGPMKIEYSGDGGATYELVAENEANDGSFTWTVPDRDSDRSSIRVTAADRAGRIAQAVSGLFIVDAVAPMFTAVTVDATHISLTFSEPVSGLTAFAEWRIDGTTARSTSPTGNLTNVTQMTLETAGDPIKTIGPADTPTVEYAPALPVQELVDRAGQPIPAPDKVVIARDGIAPPPPVIEDPTAPTFSAFATYAIKGTAESGALVRVYGDADGDGQPDGDAVASGQLAQADTQFSVETPLQPDKVNLFVVTATDRVENEGLPAVVPGIDRDASAPAVTLLAPQAGDIFAAGDTLTVRWRASDAHISATPIRIEFSEDGGATFAVMADRQRNDGRHTFTLPDHEIADARVRVTATDLAGFSASADSGAFRVAACDIVGTAGDDFLAGTPLADTLCGFGGDDRIEGGDGDDLLLGGPGNDSISGGEGNDRLFGDTGDDVLSGDGGDDALTGGEGADLLTGRAGNDLLMGALGVDVLNGGSGVDELAGGLGADTLSGGSGRDLLKGGRGRDLLKGGPGRDFLRGGSGADRLVGGPSLDICRGGRGPDSLRTC